MSSTKRFLAARLSAVVGVGIASFYFKHRANVGDCHSSPTLYFPQLEASASFDPLSAKLPRIWRHRTVLVGGGGLIAHPDFNLNMEALVAYRPRNLIAWGVGHNAHGRQHIDRYPAYLRKFDLVGVRDYGVDYPWVPCASCLHPGFDRDYEVTEDFVVYQNSLCSPLYMDGFKTLANTETDLETVLRFLGSANTVLTSSYHGAYWATLLRRKVIIVNPFSSKFSRMKHSHPVSDERNWRACRRETRLYPDALEECRAANRRFAAEVFARVA